MLELYRSKKIFDTTLISSVASTQNLNDAFNTIYKNRKKYHHNNDISYLSKNWELYRKQIQSETRSVINNHLQNTDLLFKFYKKNEENYEL